MYDSSLNIDIVAIGLSLYWDCNYCISRITKIIIALTLILTTAYYYYLIHIQILMFTPNVNIATGNGYRILLLIKLTGSLLTSIH